jgi:hypothetical protein
MLTQNVVLTFSASTTHLRRWSRLQRRTANIRECQNEMLGILSEGREQNRMMAASSRSTLGTRKTTSSIDFDSRKYIERDSLGQTKRGQAGVSDAAHIFSYGLLNSISTHSSGRPLSEEKVKEVHRDMNHSSNMRIKSIDGNRVKDERRDARIAAAFISDQSISGKSTINRAHQAYKSASSFTSLDSITNAFGNLRIYNEDTGRSHLLRNHDKFVDKK